ncbi:MAG: hypothetical protein Q8N26_13990 [Myxococcales bacterium]|nr:hypothetical protein [Myxococcales bacterium]
MKTETSLRISATLKLRSFRSAALRSNGPVSGASTRIHSAVVMAFFVPINALLQRCGSDTGVVQK